MSKKRYAVRCLDLLRRTPGRNVMGLDGEPCSGPHAQALGREREVVIPAKAGTEASGYLVCAISVDADGRPDTDENGCFTVKIPGHTTGRAPKSGGGNCYLPAATSVKLSGPNANPGDAVDKVIVEIFSTSHAPAAIAEAMEHGDFGEKAVCDPGAQAVRTLVATIAQAAEKRAREKKIDDANIAKLAALYDIHVKR